MSAVRLEFLSVIDKWAKRTDWSCSDFLGLVEQYFSHQTSTSKRCRSNSPRSNKTFQTLRVPIGFPVPLGSTVELNVGNGRREGCVSGIMDQERYKIHWADNNTETEETLSWANHESISGNSWRLENRLWATWPFSIPFWIAPDTQVWVYNNNEWNAGVVVEPKSLNQLPEEKRPSQPSVLVYITKTQKRIWATSNQIQPFYDLTPLFEPKPLSKPPETEKPQQLSRIASPLIPKPQHVMETKKRKISPPPPPTSPCKTRSKQQTPVLQLCCYRPSMIERVAAVYRSFLSGGYWNTCITAMLQNRRLNGGCGVNFSNVRTIVLRQGESIITAATVRLHEPSGLPHFLEVLLFATNPTHQRCGFGKLLCKVLNQLALKHKCTQIILRSSLDDDSVKFWKNQKFVESPQLSTQLNHYITSNCFNVAFTSLVSRDVLQDKGDDTIAQALAQCSTTSNEILYAVDDLRPISFRTLRQLEDEEQTGRVIKIVEMDNNCRPSSIPNISEHDNKYSISTRRCPRYTS